ncbi:DUF2271 domain-containing protein [Aquirhabdus sp.]|uniref:DUF2271 domain-containing protein n=1 Tax=Aquirhabdus sp. TaxID=2824160 RepID=UPI00396C3F0F
MSSTTRQFVLRPLVLQLLTVTGFGLSICMPTLVSAQAILKDDTTTSVQSSSSVNPKHQAHYHQDHILGTSLDVLAISATAEQTQRAFTVATAEIQRLNQILSTYRSDSEISALNQAVQDGQSVAVSDDLFAVIQACENWRNQTCGAFSARMGSVIQAKAQGTDEVSDLAEQAHHAEVILNPQSQRITRPQGVQFATDALAKGYIIDRAISAARQAVPELSGLMVDIGGDIKVWGQAPRASGWQIGLRDAGQRADNLAPTQALQLTRSAAVAFSGQGARDQIGRDSTLDSHLISPISGAALNHVEQSIVVAPHAADADALATALAAMTPQDAMALIEQLQHVEAQLTLTNGETFNSSGWHNLVATEQHYGNLQSVANTTSASTSSGWPAGYSAVLDYDIPKIESSNYKAPYVVIWVTNADRKLVRTLHVWGSKEKWIDSNYIWWKRYGRTTSNLDTIAKPSRAPGHYTAIWDGKDDAGQLVPQGKYTVHIEAAREHGAHSYQTFDLDAAPKASNKSLPAKDELGDLKLRFDRAI